MMNWEKEQKGKTIGDSAGEDMNGLKEFSKSTLEVNYYLQSRKPQATRVQIRKEPEVP